ncbi:MAG: YIP1 family protein [Bacteroidota bacterium]
MNDTVDVETGSGAPHLSGTAPVGAEYSVVPDPGPIGRLVGVFFRPRRTFESMRERPRFLLAAIILLVVQTALALVLFRSGVIAEMTIAKMEAEGKDQHQIEAVQTFFEGPAGLMITVGTAPFATAVGILSGAALLFFMANLMMGARLRFNHYVSAVVFAGIVQIVDQVVRVVLILLNRSFDVRLGAGNLLGDATGPLVRALDTVTDPLFLWGNAICALAVAVYAGKKFGFGALAVIPGMILAVIFSISR